MLGDADLAVQVEHASGFGDAVERALQEAGGDRAADPDGLPSRWLDLGSGGGLPGLVLAARWPESEGALLDASSRSTGFLTSAVDACGYRRRMQVLLGRAEALGRDPPLRAAFDVVVARSFGPPPVVAECAAPFLCVGGVLVVSEPPVDPRGGPATGHADSSPNPRWPAGPLASVGLRPIRVVRNRFGYQVLQQVSACPERFPRRVGVPAKRPVYQVLDREPS